MVSVYSKPQCPACDEAKALLDKKGIEYHTLVLGKDFDMDNLMEMFAELDLPLPRSFPVIVDNDTVMTLTELKSSI